MPLSPQEQRALLEDERAGKLDAEAIDIIRRWRDDGRFPAQLAPVEEIPAAVRMAPSAGGMGVPFVPSGPEEQQGYNEALREGARFGIPAATSLAGSAAGAATAPWTGPLGAIGGEMLGSLGGRRINQALGLDPRGTFMDRGDIEAIAIPGAFGAARLGKRAVGQFIAPSIRNESIETVQKSLAGDTAEELIKIGGRKTVYDRGKLIQEALDAHEQELSALAKEQYAPIRQAVPDLEVSAVESFANKHHVSLADALVGSEVERTVIQPPAPPTPPPLGRFDPAPPMGARPVPPAPEAQTTVKSLSFDDAITVRSRLYRYGRMLEHSDPQKAAAYNRVAKRLDQDMEGQARSVGMDQQWRDANEWYKREYVGRFNTRIVEQLMDRARTSGEQLIGKLEGMPVERAKEFMSGLTALTRGSSVPLETARNEAKAGLVQRLLDESVPDKRTGMVNADTLLKRLSAIPDETRRLILGPDLADGLVDFATRLSGAKNRAAMTIGVGGAATAGGLIAGGMPLTGGAGLAAALGVMLESANETSYLARALVSRPKIARAMTDAVLTNRADRLNQLTGMQGLGIIGGQVLPRTQTGEAFGLGGTSAVTPLPEQERMSVSGIRG